MSIAVHDDVEGRPVSTDGTDTQQAETVFTARPGETTTVDYIWLPETTLLVKAVDATTGVPVDGFCGQVPNHVWNPVCSDPDGAVTIPGLPPTSLTIDVATPAGSLHFGRQGVPATVVKTGSQPSPCRSSRVARSPSPPPTAGPAIRSRRPASASR